MTSDINNNLRKISELRTECLKQGYDCQLHRLIFYITLIQCTFLCFDHIREDDPIDQLNIQITNLRDFSEFKISAVKLSKPYMKYY